MMMHIKNIIGMMVFLPVFSYAAFIPDTPVAFKLGVGVIENDTLYIGLGSAGKSWYKLNMRTENKHWEKIADFPGVARNQAVSAIVDGKIYVFGGIGENKDGLTQSLTDAYMYNPVNDTWISLMTHAPQSLVGSAMFAHNKKLFVIGGVNQNIFNGYFEDIAANANTPDKLKEINYNYFNKKHEDLFFNNKVLSFEPSTMQWGYAGTVPYGSAGATVVTQKDTVTVINGEVKPGLRTDAAYTTKITPLMNHWEKLPNINSPDGVSGGFGGSSQGYIIFSGGAGFKGSRNNYQSGKLYAHNGIQKHYSDTVNLYKSGKWTETTKLPYGVAYGVSIPWDDGLLMIGGEIDGGKAITQSLYLKITGGKVNIVN